MWVYLENMGNDNKTVLLKIHIVDCVNLEIGNMGKNGDFIHLRVNAN
jgi:hypothetical protein